MKLLGWVITLVFKLRLQMLAREHQRFFITTRACLYRSSLPPVRRTRYLTRTPLAIFDLASLSTVG